MKNSRLNYNNLIGEFEKDSTLIKNRYSNLPNLNSIDHYIYSLHFNDEYNCFQSILNYDILYQYRETPKFISLGKASLIEPTIIEGSITLNLKESSFLNKVFFEESINERFKNFRHLLNSYISSYRNNHKFKIICLLEQLLSLPNKTNLKDQTIRTDNLDYSKFKDILNNEVIKIKTIINDNIRALAPEEGSPISNKEYFLLKSIDIEDDDLTFFIQSLDKTTITLFNHKWEKKSFDALLLLYNNSNKKLMSLCRLIYFLIGNEDIDVWKNILDSIYLKGYKSNMAERYFNDVNTKSNCDILNSIKECNRCEKLIDKHLF